MLDAVPMLQTLRDRWQRAREPFDNIVALARDPYRFLDDLHRRGGDLFEFRLPGMPGVLVCSEPEAVRQLLTGSYDRFERYAGGVDLFVDPLGLIFLDDEPHRQRRKLLNPAFNAESVRAFGPAMLEIVDRVLDRAPRDAVAPLLGPMQDITMRVILRCLFGVAEGPRFEELRTLVIEYLQQVFAPDVVAFGALLTPKRAHRALARLARRAEARGPAAAFTPSPLPVLRVADRMGRIRAILDAEIDRCLAEGPETRGDVLALMLRARFADGQPMSRDELLAQLFMLVIGGYETTSLTLCWAVHCLAHHPDALARVRAELADVMPGEFDPARVRDLHYLGAAIAESMRLHPIAIGVSRRLRQPMHLAGRDLPAGTIVMSSVYLVQRHPDVWPEPTAFRPERMLARKPSATVHFPFGAGVWRCLGAAFAEHEMRIVLARLLTRFDVVPDPSTPIHPQQRGIAVGPAGGLPVRLAPRA